MKNKVFKRFLCLAITVIMLLCVMPSGFALGEDDNYDASLCALETITSISITNLTMPKDGEKPDYTLTVSPSGCVLDANFGFGGMYWYHPDDTIMTEDETFVSGNEYKLEIKLIPKTVDGVITSEFSSPTVSVNGNVVSSDDVLASSKAVYVYCTYLCTSSSISSINITNLTTPANGEKPDFDITLDNSACVLDANYGFGGMYWFNSDDSIMMEDDTFAGGNEYKVEIKLVPKSVNGVMISEFKTPVTATINGETVSSENVLGNSKAIYIYYTYTCPVEKISLINITNLTMPKDGEKADYTLTVSPSGCVLDASYGFGGIYWYNADDSIMMEDETFVGGNEYKLEIKLIPKTVDGVITSEFSSPTVSINGSVVSSEDVFVGSKEVHIYCTYVCTAKPISSINITDLTTPASGEKPDYEITLDNSACVLDTSYGVDGMYWYTSDDSIMTEEDTFVEGSEYKVEIKLVPKSVNGVMISEFETPVTATINGETVSSEDVLANSKVAYIYYTYTCTSGEPELVIVAYNENGGSGTMVGDMVEVGGTFTLEECAYIAPLGKKFKAWAIGGVDGEQKQPGEQITVTTETYIYAIWEDDTSEPELVMVSYNENGGSGTMDSTMVAIGETFTLEECTYIAPEGKKFKCWSVGDIEYAVGYKVVITEPTIIYAIWEDDTTEPQLLVVAYNENGGSGTMVGDMVEVGGTFTLEECAYIAPLGKKFKAWAIGGVDGEQKQPGEQITVTTETYIYAIWEDESGTPIVGETKIDEYNKATGKVKIVCDKAGEYVVVVYRLNSGKFEGVNVNQTPIVEGENEVEVGTELKSGDKIFFWEDMNSIRPLCKAYTVE